MSRIPAVAGQFYPGSNKELRSLLKGLFNRIVEKSPKDSGSRKIKSLIAPHAGYTYSGLAAARAYRSIDEPEEKDLFIILGLSHPGYPSCLSLDDWQTPLGVASNDRIFQEALIKQTGITINEHAHAHEHSLEVHVPFIQYINKEAKIAPIIVSGDISKEKFADSLLKIIEKLNRKAVIIASSDLSHIGSAFGYAPFDDNIKEKMHDLDKGAISHILNKDREGFIGYLRRTKATICGIHPISLLLDIESKRNTKARLIDYYTSGDLTGDYSHAVGYAAISFSE